MLLGTVVAVIATVGFAAFVINSFPLSGSPVTTTQAFIGKQSDCGFLTSCSAIDDNGLAISVSVNSSSVRSNGSVSIIVTLANPTERTINLTRANSWYLTGLNESWPCNSGSLAYGYEVFRGYYSLTNVSSGRNVLHPGVYPSCVYIVPPSFFVFPPKATYIPSVLFNYTSPIYAIDGGFVRQGNFMVGVNSLWSSQPGVYTMVVGDEWGNLAVIHFTVVSSSR